MPTLIPVGSMAGMELDPKGFIKTGLDLSPENLSVPHWPLARQPYLLEASSPGVFAVGDVRVGSIKRVASAVGEGSVAIPFVHKYSRNREQIEHDLDSMNDNNMWLSKFIVGEFVSQ